MSWRRDDTGFQDSQLAFAPGKTISNGSPGMRIGPQVEAKSLWVLMETRPDCSEVVHGFRALAMLCIENQSITDDRAFLWAFLEWSDLRGKLNP